MKVLVTGASGLIGSALCDPRKQGHEVASLTRSEARRPGEFRWDPDQGHIDPAALEGIDAVVHLAGESVAGRWTRTRSAASSTAASTAPGS